MSVPRMIGLGGVFGLFLLLILMGVSQGQAVESQTVWLFEIMYWTEPQQVTVRDNVQLSVEVRHKDTGKIMWLTDALIFIIDPNGEDESIISLVYSEFVPGKVNRTYAFQKAGTYTIKLIGHIWNLDAPAQHGIVVLKYAQRVMDYNLSLIPFVDIKSLLGGSHLLAIPLLVVLAVVSYLIRKR